MPDPFVAFFGGRNSLQFDSDRPVQSWREKILELMPNGDAPLTALTNLMGSESVDNPQFNWWTERLSPRGGSCAIYTDAGLADAYAPGADVPKGSRVYAKVSEALAKEFRTRQQVLLRDSDDYTNDLPGIVEAVDRNGSNSYITVRTSKNDGLGNGDLSMCDRILVIGSVLPENGTLPDATTTDPVKVDNYIQTFAESLKMSRIAMKTKLRTGDYYKQTKAKALRNHARDIEMALIHGIPDEWLDEVTGEPIRTTAGILWFIANYAPGNMIDYTTDINFAGKSWLDGGEEWLDYTCMTIFKYGSTDRIGFCGDGALLGLQTLVKDRGEFSFTPMTTAYGIQIVQWKTPFGILMLKRHPLFSLEPTNSHSILVVTPSNMKYRYISDTFFVDSRSNKSNGHMYIDGIKEGFITDCGLELHHPESFAYLNGVGLDNEL